MSGNELRNILLRAADSVPPITRLQLLDIQFSAAAQKYQLYEAEPQWTNAITEILGSTFQFTGPRQHISKTDLANNAIIRLRLGHSLDAIISDICTLMCSEVFFREHVRAVQGVQIKQRIDFSECVYIDIPSNLPPCVGRELLFHVDALGNKIPPTDLTGIVVPQNAIVVRFPCTLESALSQLLPPPDQGDNFKTAQEEVDRCFVCLALAGDCAPHDAGQATWTRLPGLSPSLYGGGAAGGHISFTAIDGTCDMNLAKLLYSQSLSMTQRDWSAIKLSAFQLIEARKSRSSANRAINLRVAAEIALMHDTGNSKSTTEITHKLAERGAALIGDSPEAKYAAFAALKKEYGATSIAIHTGCLSDDNVPDIAALDGHVSAVLRQLISRGRFPTNWNKLAYGIDNA